MGKGGNGIGKIFPLIYSRGYDDMCMQSSVTAGHYCYQVNISRPVTTIPRLLTGSSCSQNLCCTHATNGTATASFVPRIILPPPIYAENDQVTPLCLCSICALYRDGADHHRTLRPRGRGHGEKRPYRGVKRALNGLIGSLTD